MNSVNSDYLKPKAESDNVLHLIQGTTRCDRYDYLSAVACGTIGGLVDIFLVGAPTEGALGAWSDAQVDSAVMRYARLVGWDPRNEQKGNVASAIGFLERKYPVNYDQRHTRDVGGAFDMSAKNHHIKSLAHSPSPVGLFFSMLNQFTSTASFVSDGQLVTIQSETFELEGHNPVAKLFCGTANWFGHLMSDVAGSSGSRGNAGRGTGIAVPFYELFQFLPLGQFNVGKHKQDIATIAVRAFQEGYDARHGISMALPVILTDLSIRFIWALRRYFEDGLPASECIPTAKHDELRLMLLLGHGTLAVIDALDAGVRSKGNYLMFFMRLNLLAWFRFTLMVVKEIGIQTGLSDTAQMNIDAYRKIEEALDMYLDELEGLDYDRFEEEANAYRIFEQKLSVATSSEDITAMLEDFLVHFEIPLPWEDDFNEHMEDPDNYFVFE
jgi:hypothetical protein